MGALRFLLDAFAGRARLFHVVVFGYGAFIFPMAALFARARQLQQTDPASTLAHGLVGAMALYLAWIAVSLWRCAPNSARPRARWLARGVALVMGLCGVGVIPALW